MPTSSQAMILRGSDDVKTNLSCVPPVIYSQCFKGGSARCAQEKPHIPKVNCELVKFDFCVSRHKQTSLNSYEGVFAYDPTTKSYRWQICSVSPKSRCDLKGNKNFESGDSNYISSPDNDMCAEEPAEQCGEPLGTELFIDEDPSDITQHFTTPAVSLLDNSKHVINPKTELHGCSQPLTPINIPTESEQLDEASYRRLEELGFRRRTTHNSSGSLVRIKKGRSPIKTTTKCEVSSQSICRNSVAKLTINTMDPMDVPKPNKIPYKRQGFDAKPFVSGDCMRKRVRPKKPKSLLEEVKETVGWKHRVAPSMYLRRGQLTSAPTAVCFSLRDGHQYQHGDVKELVETQLDCNVRMLQYDPVSVRTSELGMYDRWIVTLHNRDDFYRAVHTGLALNGDKVIVRAWDDVVRHETLPDSPESSPGWEYPCSYRLQQEKHNLVLRNFLAVN